MKVTRDELVKEVANLLVTSDTDILAEYGETGSDASDLRESLVESAIWNAGLRTEEEFNAILADADLVAWTLRNGVAK